MWMLMDSNNDHSREFKLPTDTAIGRKLCPLMPRPLSSSSSTPYSTPSCCCIRNPNILSSNHSISGDEGVKREIEVVSTRWNPTPEQLQVLEEMYGRGIRTPSADQIQQIATKLGRFGKIQGKNVFYWFQNHKARDRQKMKRRQLHLLAGKNTQTPPPPPAAAAQRVMNNREHEKNKKKKVHMASNCSMATEEDYSASMHGAVIAAAGHKELQQSPTAENEIRWQLHLDLSSNSSTTNRLGQTEWVKERRECMRWVLCCPQLDKTNHNKTSPFLPPTVAHSKFGGATE